MKVLLSIKPEFAEMIFSGTKKYEFRRSVFKNPDVKTIVVYASSPVRKVIGEFEIGAIINDELAALWERTKKYAGINEDYFFVTIQRKKCKSSKKRLDRVFVRNSGFRPWPAISHISSSRRPYRAIGGFSSYTYAPASVENI
ncbi:MAG: hypothetical protein BWK74_05140 [Desulfobacteraceae bacterium A6]|nr:MAG: hypothetical protein BWK74_05140 [Desulfobacteraceae bacterium A6]